MPTLKWIAEHADTISIARDESVCANCAHFYLHYVKSGMYFTPICRGHCIATRRIKDRNAGDTCPMFTQKNQ